MKEKFHFVPPGAVRSPDESVETTLETRHHNALFAVILAHSIGYLDPLIARLDDSHVEDLEPIERKFVADLLRHRQKGWPKGAVPGSLQTNRKKLRVAAYFLQFDRGEPSEGRIGKAMKYARDHCGLFNKDGEALDLRVVRRYVKEAKAVVYQRWRWWDIASKMARENKIEQLHRTY
jgi:hypothetical protein